MTKMNSLKSKSDNDRNHFIAYVRWDIILEWKKDEIISGRISKGSQVKPYAYGTAAEDISEKIREGDILWIITIPRYGRFSSYASLNAMIIVDEIIDQKKEKDEEQIKKIPKYIRKKWDPIREKGWRYVIIGGKKSKYYPINYSYEEIIKPILKEKLTGLEERMKKLKSTSFGYVAQHFQKIRELKKEIGENIFEYQKEIKKNDVLFISYRRRRGKLIVKDLIEKLLKEKVNCWLDISRIPQNLTKEEYSEVEKYFKYELEAAIKESKGLLSIQQSDYWESDWTVLEYISAKKEEMKRRKRGKEYVIYDVDLDEITDDEQRRKFAESITKKLIGDS